MAIILITLGIKMWFNPDAEFTAHSCALENGNIDKDGACYKCQLKELADCPEKEKPLQDKQPNVELKK